jgi:hypothetical protein
MRWLKAGLSWLVDQAIEHWATIVAVAGSAVMTYLASISTWLDPYGPVAWGAVCIVSLLILSFVFWVYGTAQQRVAIADYTKAKAASSGTNVLSPTHDHEMIDLSSFYHPFYRRTEHVRFENCDLFGPANIAAFGCSFIRGQFNQCEAIIVREDRPVVNAIGFQYCTFVHFRMYRVTFIMTMEHYARLPAEMRAIVPVVSDGRVGDI